MGKKQTKNIIAQRNFIVGDRWLYYKIYSGAKTLESILINEISPLIGKLIDDGVILKWFFVRYNDPSKHLRIRFLLVDPNSFDFIIKFFFPKIKHLFDIGLINDIQISIYKRELERYGYNTMELAEDFFFSDSMLIISLLRNLNSHEELRWLYGLKIIDVILSCFKFSASDKCIHMGYLKDMFGMEFGFNSNLKKQFDRKFRDNKKRIESFLGLELVDENTGNDLYHFSDYHQKISIISNKIFAYREELQLEVDIKGLVNSFIHMSMNRLFKSKNRLHELVCYDFLFKHYRSIVGREKYNL